MYCQSLTTFHPTLPQASEGLQVYTVRACRSMAVACRPPPSLPAVPLALKPQNDLQTVSGSPSSISVPRRDAWIS